MESRNSSIMGDTDKRTFRVGTRKSELALIQTNFVVKQLTEATEGKYNFSLTTMETIGDKILDIPLPKIGEKHLFTQELEKALEDGEVDFVVHSLKDLPTLLPHGKVIGAVLKRIDPHDCVIVNPKHKNLTLETLPKGSVIGTSSLRRTAQINKNYPHLKIESIRGNMNTRLKKLNDGLFDAIVVALAGCKRLNWSDKINEVLERDLYAVGQGALAVECMADNDEVLSLLTALTDRETALSVTAERSFLRKLEGGCSAPVAVHCTIDKNTIQLTGLVCSLDGSEAIQETAQVTLTPENEVERDDNHNSSGENNHKRVHRTPVLYCGVIVNPRVVSTDNMADAEKLGEDLALLMISKGASIIMENARKEVASNIPS